MLIYLATYPRSGSSVLRHLMKLNFGLDTDVMWDVEPGDRAALAASEIALCAKTHAPPLAQYLSGEFAIQLVRHPGRTLASHYRLHHLDPTKARPMKRFIAGQRQTGDWTNYHRAWANAPLPFLRLRYEDVTTDPRPGVQKIADLLGLPMPDQVAGDPPEAAQARNPTRNPIAAPDSWRDLFSVKDMMRLKEAHGELAARFGYGFD
jgi:hypothetical protein